MMQLTSVSRPPAAALARWKREREAERRDGAGVEEVAAREPVAECGGAVGIQSNHGATPEKHLASGWYRFT